ncbi:MAG: hypothetical protein Q4F05_07965 [bacterium]|nr:hypothetical protein [bacterium]
MRTTKEQTSEILNRVNNYKIKQKRKQKAALSIGLCLTLCVVSWSAFHALWNGNPSADSKEETSILETDSSVSESNITGVTLSSLELPSSSASQLSDMIGLVIYQGHIYQDSGRITVNQKTKDALVGTYVGTATGSIDEWTSNSNSDEYEKDFASTFAGDIYTVSGYSSDFRLCTFYNEGDVFYIQLLDYIDGITLITGKDLLTTRLSLLENYSGISFSTYSEELDYEEDTPSTTTIKMRNETITSFFAALNDAAFLRDQEFSDNKSKTLKQFFVSVQLKDGTNADFLVYENGYVKYMDFFDPVYLTVSGEAFDQFFNLLCNRSK